MAAPGSGACLEPSKPGLTARAIRQHHAIKPFRILYSAAGPIAHVAVQVKLPKSKAYRQVAAADVAIERLPAFVDKVIAASLLAIHGKYHEMGFAA